jgi:endonuclease YncB( thermonuclease family)
MMFGDFRFWRHVGRIAGLWATMLGAAAHADDAAPCRLQAIGAGTVARVIDGRGFVLTDGREIRLAAIEVPPAAQAALEALIGGREVALKTLGAAADRYGRVPAFAFVSGVSVQETLLRHGQVRVAARVGDMACAAWLLGLERSARTDRLGLWAEPVYGMRQAKHPADVLAERGRFTLVEGKVLSVRESGSTIYMNFGRRWSEDFTATVLKRNERSFTSAGRDLKKLSGKTVRIRA